MTLLRRWATPPTFPEDERTHLALLTHTVLLLTVAFTVLGSAAALFVSRSTLEVLFPSGVMILLELAAVYVMKRGRVRAAAWLMTAFVWTSLVVVVVFMGGIAAGTVPLLLVAVVIAALTTGRAGNLLFSVATFAFVSVLYALEVSGWQLPLWLGETALNTWVSATTAIAATSIFITVAMRSFQASAHAAYNHRRQLEASTVSQAHMEGIIHSMSDMLLVLDRSRRIATVNRALLERLGYTEADLVGQPLAVLLPPGERDITARLAVVAPAGGFHVHTTYRPRAGAVCPVRLTVTPIRDDSRSRVLCVAQDLTDLMQTQRELRHERNLLRTLLDSLPDSIHVKSVDGRYLVSNRAHTRLLGAASPAEIIGKTAAEVFGEAVAAPFAADDAHIRQTGESIVGVERRGVDPNGAPIWLYTTKVPLLDDDGTLTGIVAIATDITHRKQSEARLRESEARNRALLAAMPDTVLVMDDSGRHVAVKAKHTADLLAPPDEIVGRRIADLLPGGHPLVHRYLAAIQRCLATDEPRSLTYTLDNTLGGRGHFETRLARLNAREVVCVVRNITDQHEAELEIRQRELMYRTLARHLPRTAVMLYDRDLRYLIAEGEALAEVGYDQAMLEGRRLPDAFPEVFAQVGGAYRRALAGETVHHELVLPGTHRHYSITFVPCRNDDGEIFAGMVVTQDVTADRHRTQEIRQYADALEQSNDALESFAYIASHDLQEPLRKIQAFADRLTAHLGGTLDPTAADYLARMTGAATRMQQLIADLLVLSRVTTQAQPFRPVDLGAVWAGVLADLEVQVEGAGATVIAAPLPTIDAERSQMRQLLQNLLANALKYRRDGVAPHITLGVAYPDPNTVSLALTDNGIGFAPEHAERIFGPFQRLHGRSKYAGTGMGLAICRKIVERHKGTIYATGEPGAGACFTVTLPRTQRPLTDEDHHARP